jgi:hypothetical protein
MKRKNLLRKKASMRKKRIGPVRLRAPSGLTHVIKGKLGRELAER